MGARIDEAGWPLVEVRWQGMVTDAETVAFLESMDRWLVRRQTFGLLLDSRGALGLTASQRHLVLEHMKSRSALSARYLVQAVVMDNLIQRTLYQAMNVLHPMPFPSTVHAEPEPARRWLAAQLAAAALSA